MARMNEAASSPAARRGSAPALQGKSAVVTGSTSGIGLGIARTLAEAGCNIMLNGFGEASAIEQERAGIAKDFGVKAGFSSADLSKPVEVQQMIEAANRDLGQVDILVNNAGGPPAGDFRTFSRADWLAAIDANMLSAIELIKATIDPMIARRFGRIVNITSGAVKAPISYLALSNGARSGLTGFVAGLAREVSRHNVTINNLLPGSFETDRLVGTARTQGEKDGLSVEEQLARWQAGEASGRFGDPKEFGAVCAFLCSIHAGYLTGQNLLMDGGTYPGTF